MGIDIGELLKKNDFRFNKRFGQNFITDGNLLAAIADDGQIQKTDTVLEIGAGAGTLTATLALRAERVVSYEIDENLRPVLAETLALYKNVRLIFGDVMRFSENQIHEQLFSAELSDAFSNAVIADKALAAASETNHAVKQNRKTDAAERTNATSLQKYKVVANLPYYITTPILFKFLYDPCLTSATVMVQKEVAQRMAAAAATPEYGALSAQLQAMGEVKLMRTVSRKLFKPEPEVDSAVIRLTVAPKCEAKLLPVLRRVIAAAFAMRRKTLLNNLSAAFSLKKDEATEWLIRAGVKGEVRGETLSVGEFIALARAYR